MYRADDSVFDYVSAGKSSITYSPSRLALTCPVFSCPFLVTDATTMLQRTSLAALVAVNKYGDPGSACWPITLKGFTQNIYRRQGMKSHQLFIVHAGLFLSLRPFPFALMTELPYTCKVGAEMNSEWDHRVSGPVCFDAELFLAILICSSLHPAWCFKRISRDPWGSCVDFLSSGVCSPPARTNRQAWAMMLVGAAFLKASWTRRPRFT